jgi:hypothetical protein
MTSVSVLARARREAKIIHNAGAKGASVSRNTGVAESRGGVLEER